MDKGLQIIIAKERSESGNMDKGNRQLERLLDASQVFVVSFVLNIGFIVQLLLYHLVVPVNAGHTLVHVTKYRYCCPLSRPNLLVLVSHLSGAVRRSSLASIPSHKIALGYLCCTSCRSFSNLEASPTNTNTSTTPVLGRDSKLLRISSGPTITSFTALATNPRTPGPCFLLAFVFPILEIYGLGMRLVGFDHKGLPVQADGHHAHVEEATSVGDDDDPLGGSAVDRLGVSLGHRDVVVDDTHDLKPGSPRDA
ncbi:hypothetical protein HPP92_006607 [Vanilla planifolia]|uniref:Uncharacterized protein n=1 Tax=Vanilla planifolia TaxID=51239 RepID=A0A835V997_VANPL|nr:hypothetical protein HPP92_006607 [Vanilla planifolia]